MGTGTTPLSWLSGPAMIESVGARSSTNPRERPDLGAGVAQPARVRKRTGIGDSPSRRLQRRDPAIVSGHPETSTGVAAETDRRSPGRLDRRLTAAASGDRALPIKWVARPAVHRVVRHATRSSRRHVCLSERDRARSTHAGDRHRVLGWHDPTALAQTRPRLNSGGLKDVLRGERNTVKRAGGHAARDRVC